MHIQTTNTEKKTQSPQTSWESYADLSGDEISSVSGAPEVINDPEPG